MKLKISESLKNLPVIDYRTLEPFQKNLKDLTQQNYARLLKSFVEFGFMAPIFIWKNQGKNWIIDAHQRHRVLINEKAEPFELPYIEIEAVDELEAKKKLLVISSQYGTITHDGFDEFAFDIPDDWKKDTINFDRVFMGWGEDPANDPAAEWKGMPESDNPGAEAFRSITAHFKDQQAVDDFSAATGKPIRENTRYLWFPEEERDIVADKGWKSES